MVKLCSDSEELSGRPMVLAFYYMDFYYGEFNCQLNIKTIIHH